MKKIIFIALFSIILAGHSKSQEKLIEYVDPFIGTTNGANCFPGAAVPFGMVQLSPDAGQESADDFVNNRPGRQYNYQMTETQGFGHLHLNGTASDPAGDLSVLPMVDQVPSASFLKSRISHQEEWASPGYYSVILQSFGIKGEMTTTTRCGLHRYTFPASDNAVIRIDLAYANGRGLMESWLKKLNDSTFVGSRFSSGYADDKRVFFAIRTSKPVRDVVLFADTAKVKSKEEVHAVGIRACLVFSTLEQEQIQMKVALSFADSDGALQGLNEIPDWDFERVRNEAESKWEKELQKIRVFSDDTVFKRIFYTSVYHSYLSSARFDDANGNYRGPDEKIHQGSPIYSQFGLWDTFRALFPLYSATQPEIYADIIRSFLAFYEQYGLLPVWEMAFCETHCMTGYHAVPVIADAILKDIKGFPYEEAYNAMRTSAMMVIRNMAEYREYGYIPFELSEASVTKTVEYAFDDWCVAQAAKKLGKTEDYKALMQRNHFWKNLFDKQVRFIRPKYSDGNWVPGFDPLSEHTNGKESYTEGNAWHYTFMVPQDPYGLIEAVGGRELFVKKLDSLFLTPYPAGSILGSMGGIIGQYAHGNQPSHTLPFFYNFVGMPWRTAEIVNKVMTSFYSDRPDGITGNEDTGSMSSWYVWNAIGLFPFNPVSGEYLIGSPLADRVVITLSDGNTFVIKAENRSKKNIYVQSAILNGKPYSKSYINHDDIVAGGELVLVMGEHPSDFWGVAKDDLPGNKIP